MSFRKQENREIRSLAGGGYNSVPSTVARCYDFRKPGGYLGNVGLKVEDADKAAKFYQEVFGFVPTDIRRDGDHVSVHLTDGEFDLAMVSFDSEEDSVMAKIVGTGPCIHHFGIDVDDMDSMVSKIKDLGGEILTDPSNPGATTVKFRVPGGGGITEIAPVDWHARKVGT